MALNADGDFCYSGGQDGTIRIWRVPDEGKDPQEPYEPAQENSLSGHTGAVVALTRGNDHTLVSAGHDGTCRVWDTVDGSCTAIWRAPGEEEPEEGAQPRVRPTSVEVLQHNPSLVLVGYDNGVASVVNLDTGSVVRTLGKFQRGWKRWGWGRLVLWVGSWRREGRRGDNVQLSFVYFCSPS